MCRTRIKYGREEVKREIHVKILFTQGAHCCCNLPSSPSFLAVSPRCGVGAFHAPSSNVARQIVQGRWGTPLIHSHHKILSWIVLNTDGALSSLLCLGYDSCHFYCSPELQHGDFDWHLQFCDDLRISPQRLVSGSVKCCAPPCSVSWGWTQHISHVVFQWSVSARESWHIIAWCDPT